MTDSPVARARRVLWMSPLGRDISSVFDGLPEGAGCTPIEVAEGSACSVEWEGERFEWVAHQSSDAALRCLQTQYVNMVVIDLRGLSDPATWGAQIEWTRQLLARLDHAHDLEQRYGFHRILVLVPPRPEPGLDGFLVELGGRGIRHVLRPPASGELGPPFAALLLNAVLRVLRNKSRGRTAVCASGGGITGIFFEMGAIKCLDDALVGARVNDFDMLFGISAGAVVTSVLAVGYSIGEMMAAVAGYSKGRVPPLNLSLARASHINYRDMRWRLATALRAATHTARDVVMRRARPDWDGLFLDYTALVGAPFHSRRFEEMLREVLSANGGTNDFCELPRALHIGATDQDQRRAVLFGSERCRETPISQAVQASLSINPAFGSVAINGRYYEDGAITRTSNFVEAIHRGAKLIFVLDPFVPYVSKVPGVSHRRGMLYNIDQDIRTISYTRYEATRQHVLRQHPEVSSYTFLPSNSLRRLLSVNPMDHRPYLEIWKGAYLSTLQRLEQLRHRIRGDLAEQGMVLDTGVPEAIAARLRATEQPRLEDFFTGGRVELDMRPLLQ